MRDFNKIKTQWTRGFWLFCQVVGALSLVTSPIWIRKDFGTAPSLLKKAFVEFRSTELERSTITSQILKIPNAETWKQLEVESKTFNQELYARQLRFVPEDRRSDRLRVPASLESNEIESSEQLSQSSWQLTRIERLQRKSWGKIDLIFDEDDTFWGSVFVELEEGENQFRVTFSKTSKVDEDKEEVKDEEEKVFPMLLRYSKKSKPL